jgi:hypothetical protein
MKTLYENHEQNHEQKQACIMVAKQGKIPNNFPKAWYIRACTRTSFANDIYR